jgi:transcriptional regulator MraZ
MTFFKGQEQYSIDAKGRVNIPAKMRKCISPEANDTFAITRGVDKCIEVYPLDEWKKYEEKFRGMNQYDERKRYFLRTILRWTEEVSLDAQQRITVPKKLIGFAGIEKQAVIVGMGDHIELWKPEEFEAYLDKHEESYEDVAAEVMTI